MSIPSPKMTKISLVKAFVTVGLVCSSVGTAKMVNEDDSADGSDIVETFPGVHFRKNYACTDAENGGADIASFTFKGEDLLSMIVGEGFGTCTLDAGVAPDQWKKCTRTVYRRARHLGPTMEFAILTDPATRIVCLSTMSAQAA
jgi:hypothetical protein